MSYFDDEDEKQAEAIRLRNQALGLSESNIPSPELQPPITTLQDNDIVRNYLLKKEEARKQAEEQKSGLGWRQALSGAFAGLGGGADAVIKNDKRFDDIRNRIDYDTVGQVDRDEKNRIEMEKVKREQNDYNKKQSISDPSSPESVRFRATLRATMPQIANAYGKEFDNISAADADNVFNFGRLQSLKEERASLQQQRLQEKHAENQLKQEEKQKKAEYEASPKGRLEKLNSSDKARYDNALMVLQGLDEMEKALNAGQNTFSAVGDNDFTAAERRATEAFGRMQSGGAINREEEGRFRKTLPGMTDSSEMQRKKIQTQRDEMKSRLKTLGFSPEETSPSKPKENVTSKPKSIIQNGHTYILNESTGEYE